MRVEQTSQPVCVLCEGFVGSLDDGSDGCDGVLDTSGGGSVVLDTFCKEGKELVEDFCASVEDLGSFL